MAFHVGQKVVCVKEFVSRPTYGETWPTIGQTYTIRGFPEWSDGRALWLNEIVHPINKYQQGLVEVAFMKTHFRPVVEPKTDISIFTAMLTPKKATVSA